jgi:hypothetical protein
MVDSVAYLQRASLYDEIVVFIYDSSASVEHHDLTRTTLMQVSGIADVIIVSRPGVLAASSDQGNSKPKAKKANVSAAKARPHEEGVSRPKAAPPARQATRRTTADTVAE